MTAYRNLLYEDLEMRAVQKDLTDIHVDRDQWDNFSDFLKCQPQSSKSVSSRKGLEAGPLDDQPDWPSCVPKKYPKRSVSHRRSLRSRGACAHIRSLRDSPTVDGPLVSRTGIAQSGQEG